MKHILTLSLIILFSTNILLAQTPNQQISKQVLKEIKILTDADLNLSDIQVSRITSVLLSQEQILTRNIQALNGNKSLLSQRSKEIKESKISNIKGAMTPQQVEKFDALKLEEKL